MFGIDDALLGSIAGPLIGGLLGGEDSSQGQTTQNTVDPRFAESVYGANGILPNAASWYGQNKSGMNQQMLTGMNNQWSQLGASQPGYQQMQNLGLSLMGGGVAGNPFSGGNAGGGAGGGSQGGAPSYQPAPMQTGSQQFQMPTAPAYTPPAQQAAPQQQTPEEAWQQMLFDRGGMR